MSDENVKLRPVDKIIGGVLTAGGITGVGAALIAALPFILPLVATTK